MVAATVRMALDFKHAEVKYMSKYKGVISLSALFILLSFVFGFHYVKGEVIKEKLASFKFFYFQLNFSNNTESK
ncbi:hypothetical protein O9993_19145 [Vibrio lentus]|nr:hypothetical protein [Vibrio lentus]